MRTREEWLAERRTGLGSSDAPIIAGVSRWKTPFQLWAEKVGLPTVEPDGEWLEWGLRLEPLIAEKYAEETGRRLVDPEPFQTPAASRASLVSGDDRSVHRRTRGSRWASSSSRRPPPGKRTSGPRSRRSSIRSRCSTSSPSPAPRSGSLAVLIGGQRFRWCDLPRNDRFIAILLEREAAFWRRVETGDPPAVDGTEGTRELPPRALSHVDAGLGGGLARGGRGLG